jgi:hypothetical protein
VLDYHPGESMKDWLRRHGAAPGSTVPTRVPYYVLLVGGPAEIPFSFQYHLDIEYAVGRLAFDDPGCYARYAAGVVDYETAPGVSSGREVAYWGPRHPGDRATELSDDCLLRPLVEGTPAEGGDPAVEPIARVRSFRWRWVRGADARRAALLDLLHPPTGADPPAVLFTASHGVGWPKGHARQLPAQGALLCQDWPGAGIPESGHYLAAADVQDGARLHGLVAFLFACFSAGTPATDNFLEDAQRQPVPLAEQPFLAALPQRLLAHPGGSALAVIGHVDRAWGFSIRPPGLREQVQPFRNLLGRILAGQPVGHATRDFSERYASLSTVLLSILEAARAGAGPTAGDLELIWTWVERNDAQNYVLLGDPAARLRVDLLR